MGRLAQVGPVLEAGMRAAVEDQRVFDDLVELGLGGGPLTGSVVRGLVRAAGAPLWHVRPGGG